MGRGQVLFNRRKGRGGRGGRGGEATTTKAPTSRPSSSHVAPQPLPTEYSTQQQQLEDDMILGMGSSTMYSEMMDDNNNSYDDLASLSSQVPTHALSTALQRLTLAERFRIPQHLMDTLFEDQNLLQIQEEEEKHDAVQTQTDGEADGETDDTAPDSRYTEPDQDSGDDAVLRSRHESDSIQDFDSISTKYSSRLQTQPKTADSDHPAARKKTIRFSDPLNSTDGDEYTDSTQHMSMTAVRLVERAGRQIVGNDTASHSTSTTPPRTKDRIAALRRQQGNLMDSDATTSASSPPRSLPLSPSSSSRSAASRSMTTTSTTSPATTTASSQSPRIAASSSSRRKQPSPRTFSRTTTTATPTSPRLSPSSSSRLVPPLSPRSASSTTGSPGVSNRTDAAVVRENWDGWLDTLSDKERAKQKEEDDLDEWLDSVIN